MQQDLLLPTVIEKINTLDYSSLADRRVRNNKRLHKFLFTPKTDEHGHHQLLNESESQNQDQQN